jgi:hypothetical protein
MEGLFNYEGWKCYFGNTGRIISAFQFVKADYLLNPDEGSGVTVVKIRSGQEERYEIQHAGSGGRKASRSKG